MVATSSKVSSSATLSSATSNNSNIQSSEIRTDNVDNEETFLKYVTVNGSKLIWSGTLQDLLSLAVFHLEFNRESVKITETDNKKTLKADHLVLNWYKSTGTLQFQGSEAARYKAYLNQLIAGSKDLKDANEPQAKCCHVDDTNDEQNINNVDRDQTTSPETTAQTTSPNENVSVSEFTREIGKIWSKI